MAQLEDQDIFKDAEVRPCWICVYLSGSAQKPTQSSPVLFLYTSKRMFPRLMRVFCSGSGRRGGTANEHR